MSPFGPPKVSVWSPSYKVQVNTSWVVRVALKERTEVKTHNSSLSLSKETIYISSSCFRLGLAL
jgi:hypothetical protein